MGWARVQATSRGGHGDEAHYNRRVLYGAKALTSNRVLPHCERKTDVTGSEAAENKVSTTPRARAAPHRGGFSVCLRALGVVETVISTASDPVTTVLLPSQCGSILLLVKALAPYSTPLL